MAVRMVSIVPVCCICWLNKVLNSVRKAETVPRDQNPGDWGDGMGIRGRRGFGEWYRELSVG